MSPTGNYLNAITNRRTIYNLKPELPQGVGLDDVKRTVHVILKNTPTAFNSQVNRAVIIVGDTHKRIWDAVASAMPTAEAKKRPESCRDEAYGSVIFFTDEGPTEKLQRDFQPWQPLSQHAPLIRPVLCKFSLGLPSNYWDWGLICNTIMTTSNLLCLKMFLLRGLYNLNWSLVFQLPCQKKRLLSIT